jgi:transcriptional regulator with XRE-family HTH domain
MNDIEKQHLFEQFGKKLTYEREQRGYSLQEFSAMTGIGLIKLKNIEQGAIHTRLDALVAIMQVLNMKASELLGEIPNNEDKGNPQKQNTLYRVLD